MSKPELTTKQKKALSLAALLLALAVVSLIAWKVGVPLLRFASQPDEFRDWVDQHGVWGRLAFVGMVIFQVILALVPGEPFEIAAGYAFGALEGTFLCLLAGTLGSMGVFYLVRRFGRRLAEVFFPAEKLDRLRFLHRSPRRDLLFLLVFMIPGTPKDLLCWFAGMTDMKPLTWLLICSLGRLPSILGSTLGGDALGDQDYWLAAGVFAASLVISGGGLLLYQHICKRKEQEGT